MNVLKGLFKSNSDIESDAPVDTPSSESQNEQWQNIQPWGYHESVDSFVTPDANQSRNAPSKQNVSTQDGGRNGWRANLRSTPTNQPQRRNQRSVSRPQSANPFAPQGQPAPQRVIQAPGFGLQPRMPSQKMFNPGQNSFGQQWGGRLPVGSGHMGTRRQMQMFNEWGVPLPSRNANFPNFRHFSPFGAIGNPHQYGIPGRTLRHGVPRRPIRQLREPWF
jgi:hypothetical protein